MIVQNGERTTTYMLHDNKLTISTTGSKPVTRETSSLTKNKPENLDQKGEENMTAVLKKMESRINGYIVKMVL